MKKRTVIAIVLTTGLTIVSDVIHADMNTEPDIKVVLPPELFAPSVKKSPDAVTQYKLRRRLLLNISHENEGYSLSTLGQLAKLCDAAVFGHVQEIKDVTAVEKQNSRSRDYSLTVSVVSNLLAGKISSPLTVKYHQWFWKVEVKPGGVTFCL